MKEVVKAEEGEIFDIELEADLLKANEELATKNRELLRKHGVMAIDVMGSIGSGKTTLIEKLVQALKKKYKIAVFKGDLTTTIDAELIGRHGIEVVPINTGKECHLDANLVKKALQKINLEDIDLLFIENVGNLICPADFPLGSEKRVVVISVTEGPYMVVKHPFIFMDADVAVINKKDLAQAMGVDIKKLKADVGEINPNVKVVATNGRSGEGVKEVVDALGL
ncbi:MAG: hydrogenase nickel incorporation protein HypB [Candidatus Bathyarchaeota archaeon]|nr:hydrogenase nickel incorporation protein HypB [Candidatus Bathyarchaeota archaeon]MDH5418752.1 hydrogenase nickel incorporation protein HypB [Candidatus Bathyarchaeota archaeon]MDH5623104.1 hydrogenase nickel incorporation protein HypB [Candidatus Bathyarchaeota archaeon]MDH5701454.1 hydrogenase nickel incorporation protein HypB [Candidatus Bathyarchaeota archaeon]